MVYRLQLILYNSTSNLKIYFLYIQRKYVPFHNIKFKMPTSPFLIGLETRFKNWQKTQHVNIYFPSKAYIWCCPLSLKSIHSLILQFIYHSNWNILNFKIYNFEHIFCMLFFSGRAKYVCKDTSTLPFLSANHNQSLPAKQGLTSHSHHIRCKYTLIIPYLMPLEVFYQTHIIILPCMYFWLFPWQPTLCSILLLFLYLGGSTGSGQQCSNYQVSIFHTVQQLLVRHTSNNAATIRQAHPKQWSN